MARYWSISAVPVSAHLPPLVITTKLAAAIYGGAANNEYKYSIQYCPCGVTRGGCPHPAPPSNANAQYLVTSVIVCAVRDGCLVFVGD